MCSEMVCNRALRIRATLASRLALRERESSSPMRASRRQWLRISTPPQCPRINVSHCSGWYCLGRCAGQVGARFGTGGTGLFDVLESVAGRPPDQQRCGLAVQFDDLPQVIAHRPACSKVVFILQASIKPLDFLLARNAHTRDEGVSCKMGDSDCLFIHPKEAKSPFRVWHKIFSLCLQGLLHTKKKTLTTRVGKRVSPLTWFKEQLILRQ